MCTTSHATPASVLAMAEPGPTHRWEAWHCLNPPRHRPSTGHGATRSIGFGVEFGWSGQLLDSQIEEVQELLDQIGIARIGACPPRSQEEADMWDRIVRSEILMAGIGFRPRDLYRPECQQSLYRALLHKTEYTHGIGQLTSEELLAATIDLNDAKFLQLPLYFRGGYTEITLDEVKCKDMDKETRSRVARLAERIIRALFYTGSARNYHEACMWTSLAQHPTALLQIGVRQSDLFVPAMQQQIVSLLRTQHEKMNAQVSKPGWLREDTTQQRSLFIDRYQISLRQYLVDFSKRHNFTVEQAIQFTSRFAAAFDVTQQLDVTVNTFHWNVPHFKSTNTASNGDKMVRAAFIIICDELEAATDGDQIGQRDLASLFDLEKQQHTAP